MCLSATPVTEGKRKEEEEVKQEEGEQEDLLRCSSGREASPVLVFPPL